MAALPAALTCRRVLSSRIRRATAASAATWSLPAPGGNQQEEDEIHGLAVDRLEVDWSCEADEQAEQMLHAVHASVRQGEAPPEPGGAQPLARG